MVRSARTSFLHCPPLAGAVLVAMIVSAPRLSHAQLSEASHWGVTASFAPTAESVEFYRKHVLGFDGQVHDVKSSGFSIGIARGSMRGGDWSVSFVRKAFKDGSFSINEEEPFCDTPPPPFRATCYGFTRTQTMQDVKMTGVEAIWSPTFVTIANRVQIGLNAGGGIAKIEGFVVDEQVQTKTDVATQQTTIEDVFTGVVPVEESVTFTPMLLGTVEAQVSVIVMPGLKVRFAGGMSTPGLGVRVGAVYLFGAQ